MRAEIKGLHSTLVADLETYAPPDPAVFHIPMTLLAGPKGQEGEETFDFEVCSPGWINQKLRDGEVWLLRHKIVMRTFDFGRLRKFVERYVNGIESDTWPEIASKLSRLGHWEFEDYREP